METLKVAIKNNEYWWGGVVDDAYLMPLNSHSEYFLDLTKNLTYNQGASLFLSSCGRYIWCDEGARFTFSGGEITVTAESQISLDCIGKTLKDAYLSASKKHFPFDGKYPNEDMFKVPQYCTWIELLNEQTEENILSFAKSIIDKGMPVGEIIIDNGWQTDYGDWTFNAAKFTDPKGMIKKLHKLGFKVIMWIAPYVSPDSLIFLDLVEKGGLIRTKENKPYILEWWQGFSGALDMSNEVDISWFKKVTETLMNDFGVDGFKQDGGDARFFTDENYVCKDGKRANRQSELWALSAQKYSFNEIRACFKCGGKGIAQRITDRHHKWDIIEGLASLIPNITMQGLLGYAYTCPDMVGGGLSGDFFGKKAEELDKELFIRSCECSSLMPMMQLSYAFWRVFDSETVNICIKYALLHAKLHDYIMALVKNAAITGEPIVRSMAYEFNALFEEKTQFMLGDKYLVAPVLNKGAKSRKVIFPSGKWQCQQTNKIYEAGEYEIQADIEILPYFLNLSIK